MKITALLIGILIVTGTWAVGVIGGFQALNDLIYDRFVRWTFPLSETAPVLLIPAGPEGTAMGDAVWQPLVEKLIRDGARGVAFAFFPRNASPDFYRFAGRCCVVFGRRVFRDERSNKYQPAPLPAGAQGIALKTGGVIMPQARSGICREQIAWFETEAGLYPALETVIADPATAGTGAKPIRRYRVNFCGRSDSLPRISLEQALAGNLVPGLVQGRYVLIGEAAKGAAAIHTPASPDAGISLLSYQGHALDTRITHREIRGVPAAAGLGLIAAAVLTGLLLNGYLSVRFLAWLSFPLAILYLGLAWILLTRFQVWLPIGEMVTAHMANVFIIFFGIILGHEEDAYRMAVQSSVKLKERIIPESFYESPAYWSRVMVMIDQLLDLRRTILLETIPGQPRLREVKALNCSLSDIEERRRDYRRTPYLTAMDADAPIRLERFPFLKQPPAGEVQYLAPLVFSGKVLGFWAFGIDTAKIGEIADFQGIVTDFARQIADLLYRRTYRLMRRGGGMMQYLTLRNAGSSLRELQDTFVLFERRLALLETVFQGVDIAVILYDLFGQVMAVNRRMSEEMGRLNLRPYEMTAMDLIRALAKLAPDAAREVLREIIIDRLPRTIPIRLGSEAKRYLLHVHPLQADNAADGPGQEAHPFEVYGILFEMVPAAASAAGAEILTDGKARIWVDAGGAMVAAVNDLSEKIRMRRIQFDTDIPPGMRINVPSPGAVREIARAVLDVLISDTVDGGTIAVRFDAGTGALCFTSAGFGMPDADLQRFLFEKEGGGSPAFARLRDLVRRINGWGARTTASGEIGAGMTLSIAFPEFCHAGKGDPNGDAAVCPTEK